MAIVVKTDPYAQHMFMRPETMSRVPNDVPHPWQDSAWIAAREQFDWQHQPMSVYELHPGSWRKHPDGRFYSWTELAAHAYPLRHRFELHPHRINARRGTPAG